MRCVCCGREIRRETPVQGWHRSCIRSFFGTDELPELELDEDTLRKIAEENTNRGFTVPGVQKKLSLHLTDEKGRKPRLTLINYPSGYILKPSTEEYRSLPEAEHCIMSMARAASIQTIPFSLMEANGKRAYITKRIDRLKTSEGVQSLAMEDFCQLEERLTADKYKGSCERCGKVISRFSSRKGLDLSEFFVRIVFSFITGNSDMHLKNWSLIEPVPGSGQYQLSAAYDLLPVNLVLPEDTEESALTINGRKRKLHLKDFYALAEYCGISGKAARSMIHRLVAKKEEYFEICRESYLPDDMKNALCCLIEERISVLEETA